jgi:predicted nucleotidyltransferase
MAKIKDIKKIASRIGESLNAEKVILFGSHAKGAASESSDVDLFIIADSGLPRYKRSRELHLLFEPYPFPMDLLVYTPDEVRKGLQSKLSFVSTVLKEGKTVYDRRR